MNLDLFSSKLKELGVSTEINLNQSKQINGLIPFRYEPLNLEYQRTYRNCELANKIVNLKVDLPEIYWPLLVSKVGNTVKLTSDGEHLFPPIFLSKKISSSAKRRIESKCLELLINLSNIVYVGKIQIHSDYKSAAHSWLEYAVNNKLIISISFQDVLVLNQPMEKILTALRESTRNDIKFGFQNFDINLYEGSRAVGEFHNLVQLHFEAAGRKTRSLETWKLQEDGFKNDSAVLILSREKSTKKVISGSLFEFNNLEAVYSVSAANREYFRSPVNHAMQWKAIEYFCSRNILYYRLGDRYSELNGDSKLQNISKFKRKFSSQLESKFAFSIYPGGLNNQE